MTAAPGPRQSRPRSEANYGAERGTTYLLHFDRRYKHAGHYTGWTRKPILVRLAEHLAGKGSVLTRAAVQAGIGIRLARTWPNTTRDREDSLKHQGGAKRLCPECGVKPAAPRLASDKAPEPEERRPWWQLDRDGTWLDGTPLPLATTYAQAEAYRAAAAQPSIGAADQAELAALDELERRWERGPEPPAAKPATQQEVEMFGNKARAERRQQAEAAQEAQAEADRLFALADELAKQAGERPDYLREITAERAARIRERIGEDLVRDAGVQAPESVLQGAGLDAEIDRLALTYSEYTADEFVPWEDRLAPGAGQQAAELHSADHQIAADNLAAELWPDAAAIGAEEAEAQRQPAAPEMGQDYYTQPVGSDRHRAAYAEYMEATGGPRDGWTTEQEYAADNWAELEYDRWQAVQESEAALQEPDSVAWESGDGVGRWHPGLQAERLGEDLEEHAARAAHLQRVVSSANAREHIARAEHAPDVAEAARGQAQEARQARLNAEAEAYDTAAALQEAALAEMPAEPSQADSGRAAPVHLYGTPECAEPELVTEGHPGHRQYPGPETIADQAAAWERMEAADQARWDPDAPEVLSDDATRWSPEIDAPDHIYGSPECAEADPEGDHFGLQPGEPQDAGQPPAQPAAQYEAGRYGTYGHQMDVSMMLAGMREADAEDAQRLGQPGGYPYASHAQAQLEAG
jgi:hypothetical protein